MLLARREERILLSPGSICNHRLHRRCGKFKSQSNRCRARLHRRNLCPRDLIHILHFPAFFQSRIRSPRPRRCSLPSPGKPTSGFAVTLRKRSLRKGRLSECFSPTFSTCSGKFDGGDGPRWRCSMQPSATCCRASWPNSSATPATIALNSGRKEQNWRPLGFPIRTPNSSSPSGWRNSASTKPRSALPFRAQRFRPLARVCGVAPDEISACTRGIPQFASAPHKIFRSRVRKRGNQR